MNVHADIPAFSAHVLSEFLYDMDPTFQGKTEPCTVFAVSSYKGHYPTFKILLKNGSLFDYIPAHALLVGTTTPVHSLTLGDLCYFKACPDMNITVNVHATLAGPFCKRVCWMPRTAGWVNITQYICTIDWFQDNHNAHLVVLENGQVAFVPNHKVLFLTKPTEDKVLVFQPYKKLHQEWKP